MADAAKGYVRRYRRYLGSMVRDRSGRLAIETVHGVVTIERRSA